MRHKPHIPLASRAEEDCSDRFDLDALLHPAQAFAHPMDVANDPDLTLAEKRAILASWASDACAVEAAPKLRRPPGASPIKFDDIMDALRDLDRAGTGEADPTLPGSLGAASSGFRESQVAGS